jgi:16S rRNA (uracil1498-N3)-methyltransferase
MPTDAYRFFVSNLSEQSASSGDVLLPEDQAHHARAVLRLESGAAVILFDGQGRWQRAAIERVAKHAVSVRPAGDLHRDNPQAVHLTIATAAPKGERAEWLIEQCSQLNAGAIQWLESDRGVVRPREHGQKMEKWRRLVIESAKQCGRNYVMEIQPPCALDDVLFAASNADCILWLEPGEASKPVGEALDSREFTGRITALVGPEGGWSDAERAMLEERAARGAIHRVRLTQTVLRIETACAAIAAIIMSRTHTASSLAAPL